MTHEVISEPAFLYRVHDGKLECFSGKLIKLDSSYGSQYRFARDNDKTRLCSVSSKACESHCGNVWMHIRNDKKARNILIKHYNGEIADHEKQICRLKEYIKILEKEES